MSHDETNLKQLGPNKWEVRFAYKDRLTQELQRVKRVVEGDLEDARRARTALQSAAREGNLRQRDYDVAHVRIEDFVESFLHHRKTRGGPGGRSLTHATLQQNELALHNHIVPAIGRWLVKEIRPSDIESLIDHWLTLERPNGGSYSNATLNQWIKILKVFLKHVYRVTQLGVSPAEGVQSLAKPEPPGWSLDNEQVRLFLEKMRKERTQYYALCYVGFMTGARFSELTALHWDDVDFERGMLHFGHSQYEGVRRRLTKTHKYIQRPLTKDMKQVLRHHRALLVALEHPGAGSEIVFPGAASPDEAKYNGYLSRCALGKAMRHVSNELGIPNVTPHDMRRTFNTLMLETGISPQVLKAMTGHTTDSMMIHYAHVSLRHKTEAVENLSELCGLTPSA